MVCLCIWRSLAVRLLLLPPRAGAFLHSRRASTLPSMAAAAGAAPLSLARPCGTGFLYSLVIFGRDAKGLAMHKSVGHLATRIL